MGNSDSSFIDIVAQTGGEEWPSDRFGDFVFDFGSDGADFVCTEEVYPGESEAEVYYSETEVHCKGIPPMCFDEEFQPSSQSRRLFR